MNVALVTDSNAMLPDDLVERFAVRVVPLTVVVDGTEHREGVDLTLDEFYDRLAAGAEVSTAAPAPGALVEAYEAAADAGATSVLSVHIGADLSATVSAATLAASRSPIPVEVVDTGTASFGVGACVWAAGDVIERGGEAADAAGAAARVAATVRTVFVLGAADLAVRGGRITDVDASAGAPVVATGPGGEMAQIGSASSAEGAVATMAAHVASASQGAALRVGVGDARVPTIADDLASALQSEVSIAEVVRYTVGPSVGAHTGEGTVGAVFAPAG